MYDFCFQPKHLSCWYPFFIIYTIPTSPLILKKWFFHLYKIEILWDENCFTHHDDMNVIYNSLSCHLWVFLALLSPQYSIILVSQLPGKFRIPHNSVMQAKASLPSHLNYKTGIAHTIMFYVILNTRGEIVSCSVAFVLVQASGFCIQTCLFKLQIVWSQGKWI